MVALKIAGTFVGISVATASFAADTGEAGGVWRNPQNSVHVEVQRCGASMCGTVVWANEKAIADAKRGGTPKLIGLELFRNFSQDSKGVWHGRVFVPDIRKTFSGTIKTIDPDTRRGAGCLFGGIACKSQDWVRVR